jgi:branched-chain amino acid transport system substrate-binding protein
MNKRYLTIGLLTLVLVVALVATACGGTETTTTAAPSTDTTTAPSTETTAAPSTETTAAPTTETTTGGPATGAPIKVGFSNSITGFSAAPAASTGNGVALMAEIINANGGINGRPFEIIMLDDKSDVPPALANINKLIQEDKVAATVGPFAQFMQEPARAIAEQTGTPMVGMGPATLEQLAATSQYQMSVMLSAAPPTQADATIKVIKANGWKNIIGMADVLAIHQETLDLVVQAGPTEGYTFTKLPDTFGFDQTDFQPILNKIMEAYNAQKPDAICLYVNPIAMVPLYKGLRSLGVDVPIQGSPAASNPAIFAMGPDAVEGLLVLDSGGLINPAALPDDWPLKEGQLAFYEAYQAKYGQAPDFFAAAGADLVSVLAEAMKQAGDPDDKAAVAQALINLKDFVALQGIVNFTPEATSQGVTGQMVEFQVKGGLFELVNTVN